MQSSHRAKVTQLYRHRARLEYDVQHFNIKDNPTELRQPIVDKLQNGQGLNHWEEREVRRVEYNNYVKILAQGQDEVSHSVEAARLRAYVLKSKKTIPCWWWWWFRRVQVSLTEKLFPGETPRLYRPDHKFVAVHADKVLSSHSLVAVHYFDLPYCRQPIPSKLIRLEEQQRQASPTTTTSSSSLYPFTSLGTLLQQGSPHESPLSWSPLPPLPIKVNQGCTPLCSMHWSSPRQRQWIQRLVQRNYRAQLRLDGLPVLVRLSPTWNQVERGIPLGWLVQQEDNTTQYYIYNHWKFTITYYQKYEEGGSSDDDDDDSNEQGGVYITGFDVTPMSIQHRGGGAAAAAGDDAHTLFDVNEHSHLATCSGQPLMLQTFNSQSATASALRMTECHSSTPCDDQTVVFSYEVEWIHVSPSLQWADRWDVYVLSAPDDQDYAEPLFYSRLVMWMLVGIVATLWIRWNRKTLTVYLEQQCVVMEVVASPNRQAVPPKGGGFAQRMYHIRTMLCKACRAPTLWFVRTCLADGGRADAMDQCLGLNRASTYNFQPRHETAATTTTTTAPMALAVSTGSGLHIGMTLALTLLTAHVGLWSPAIPGNVLTSWLVFYALTACTAGYWSARVYNSFDGRHWEKNILVTVTAVPAFLFGMYCVASSALALNGAIGSISGVKIACLVFLWGLLLAPLVVLGAFFGVRAKRLTFPVMNQRKRNLSRPLGCFYRWYTFCMPAFGGLLSFASIHAPLTVFLTSVWSDEIYYDVGSLTMMLVHLTTICACTSILVTHLHLKRGTVWGRWLAFGNGASVGLFFAVHCVWYLYQWIDLRDGMSYFLYCVYTIMSSVSMGMFCGSVALLASLLWMQGLHCCAAADDPIDTNIDHGDFHEPLLIVVPIAEFDDNAYDRDSNEDEDGVNVDLFSTSVEPMSTSTLDHHLPEAFVAFLKHLWACAFKIRLDKQV